MHFVFQHTVLTLCLSHSVTIPQGQETTATRPSSPSLPPLCHLSSPGLPRAILGASTNITYLFALSLITDAGMAGKERNHVEMGPLPLPQSCAS